MSVLVTFTEKGCLCVAWLILQEHVSIFGPQQFVSSTVMPDVGALFGGVDAARPRDLSGFVTRCLEEPGSLAMSTKAGTSAAGEKHLTKLQATYRGPFVLPIIRDCSRLNLTIEHADSNIYAWCALVYGCAGMAPLLWLVLA